MTHQNNIKIPTTLRFTPYEATWTVGEIEILGWSNRRVGLGSMFATTPNPPLTTFERVRAVVSTPIWSIVQMFGGLGDSPTLPPVEVELHRASLPVGLIGEHESETSEIAGRTFEVLTSRSSQLSPFTSRTGLLKNAWAMRDEFFSLPEDIYELRRFFNRWGGWSAGSGFDFLSTSIFDRGPGLTLIHPHEVWQQQAVFRRMLVSAKPSQILRSGDSINLHRRDVAPYFFIEASYCRDAITATITINKLLDAKFGICKRKDCRKIFEFTSKQKRTYCTQYCAHIENVRKVRATAKRKPKTTRKLNAKG